jgi:gas vesicle protein
MADGFDRYDREEHETGGGSFMMGLLTGTVLGAGLGMLFAPKAGSDLRNQLGEQASSLGRAAGEQYRRASDAASGIAEKAREKAEQVRGSVARGAEDLRTESERIGATAGYSGSGSTYTGGTTSPTTGSSFGSETGRGGDRS